MKFIKIDAVVGRQDDKSITQDEMDEFVGSFIEWLEQHSYETCAVWELMDGEETMNTEFKHPGRDEWLTTEQVELLVNFGHIDFEDVPYMAEEKWDDEKGDIVYVHVGQELVNLYNSTFRDE